MIKGDLIKIPLYFFYLKIALFVTRLKLSALLRC